MKTIQKALMALELLNEATPLISVGETSKRLKMPKSSTSRLLASLSAVGLLEMDPTTRTYGAGPLAGRLGALYRSRVDPNLLVRQKMSELAKSTGHSCWVGILSGQEIVVLYNAHGNHPVRYVIEPGSHLAAHSTAIGRALLAMLADDDIRQLYKGAAGGRASFPSVNTILREARLTRSRGWSAVAGHNFTGVGAIGCAVHLGPDQSPLGLSISFPMSSVNEKEILGLRQDLTGAAAWLQGRLAVDRPSSGREAT